ncbi:MAG: hypothetical protein JMDDDDMK_02489 [Acidobacteria bacterium]|nr:hypothetical protein [Acidobacteriota bacterium]
MQNKFYPRGAGALALAVVSLALSVVALAQNGPNNQASQSSQSSQTGQAAPKIVIKQLEYSFGEIKKGAVADHTFTFKNEGKADLQIRNVAPS